VRTIDQSGSHENNHALSSAVIIGVAHNFIWRIMDLGLVNEGDAHTPACERPD
jgi:hypothetical protein